ncbi:alpha/beta fold hydrolase [Mycobacterium colombiense]|uniref:alpha/beta fold hydrolase n=1 Tax=Mycobacterium colombiense TaxID=339268 RepID=UPI0009E51618|nr:alpha/beta hydrolase [Mycobacterium colombiense]
MAGGGFRNANARQQYLAAYDEVRALTPRPDLVHDIPTEFGTVRVYQHGLAGGAPVVLIHGFFLSSAMWWQQVADLTRDFTIYAMDVLGQPGASVQSKMMPTAADCARNVDAVLEGLGLRNVHLVGHSYGGWLATHTAARAPRRLATVTLVDPASTVTRLSARFWRSLGFLLSRPHSLRAEHAAAWLMGHPEPGSPVDSLAGLFVAGFAAFVPPMRTAPLLLPSDRLLHSIAVPAQVLLAGTTIHNSDKALQRIQSVVPTWRHRLWHNASHALPAEVPEEVNSCIREFVLEHHHDA